MSLTLITITGLLDGASGEVTLTRSGVLTNGTETIEPVPVLGYVLAGVLYAQDSQSPFTYPADNDLATTPVGLHTTISIQIDGAPLDEFDAVVPYNAVGATIDLTALREAAL